MKKGQVYEGTVERVDFPNKGIVRAGEETCIVKNSLPGQKVRFRVNKQRKGKTEGSLQEVIEKSPLETSQTCSHFGVCGGCTYLSLPYEEQLKIKEAQVKKLLEPVLQKQQEPYVWEGIKGSPVQYEYRNKMEFSFGDEVKGGELSLGMHKRGSFYDIVTVGTCKIVDEDYRSILKAALDYFKEKEVSFYHRLTHEGFLRHLLVRKAVRTEEILIALVTTGQEPWKAGEEDSFDAPGDKNEGVGGTNGDGQERGQKRRTAGELPISSLELIEGFKDILLALPLKGKIKGILHILNDSLADVVQSDETRILYGQDYFYEELLGLKFKISTFSFFQTNTLGAEVLYETVRDYIGNLGVGQDGKPDKVVFDLYSGTGTIAQLMAPVAGKVIGVEIVEEAVEAAWKNARLNGLENCEFIAGDVLKVLDDLSEKPDMIILDPPRDGIHPKALPKIIEYGVSHIVYVSCKPTSLARDLEVFLENGYAVERVVAVDQFPGTGHVECVILMQRCGLESKK